MNKPRALVYLHSFYPYEDANTVASEPLIEQLKKDFNVEILSYDREARFGSVSKYDGMKIWWIRKDKRIVSKATYWRWETWSNLSRRNKLLLACKKIIATMILMFAQPNNIKTLNKAIKNRPCLIVSISSPIQTQYCVFDVICGKKKRKCKYDKIKWIAVFQDPYAGYVGNSAAAEELYTQMEYVLKSVDSVCIGPEFFNQRAKEVFERIGTKVYILPVTSLRNNKIDTTYEAASYITCFYAGSLQDDRIRDPEDIFKVISHCDDEFHFQFIVNNMNKDCINKIQTYGLNENKNVTISGRKTHRECLQLIEKFDIMINIGNKLDNQLPSKVVEYISSGKPIVHFSFVQHDPVNALLERYPISLIISHEQIEQNMQAVVECFESFCKKYRKKRLSFSEVCQLYPWLTKESIQCSFANCYRSVL